LSFRSKGEIIELCHKKRECALHNTGTGKQRTDGGCGKPGDEDCKILITCLKGVIQYNSETNLFNQNK